MIRRLIVVYALLLIGGIALAQSIGGNQGIGIRVGGSGGSGSGPAGCTNMMVLDYSNACALMPQAWGQ